jgi:hypothetical protein
MGNICLYWLILVKSAPNMVVSTSFSFFFKMRNLKSATREHFNLVSFYILRQKKRSDYILPALVAQCVKGLLPR